MEMTLQERLTAIATHYNMTVASFERVSGLSNGYVRTVKNSIGSEKIESLVRAFPNVNLLWLVTGLGSMLNESDNSNSQIGKFSNNSSSFNNFQNTNDASFVLLK